MGGRIEIQKSPAGGKTCFVVVDDVDPLLDTLHKLSASFRNQEDDLPKGFEHLQGCDDKVSHSCLRDLRSDWIREGDSKYVLGSEHDFLGSFILCHAEGILQIFVTHGMFTSYLELDMPEVDEEGLRCLVLAAYALRLQLVHWG